MKALYVTTWAEFKKIKNSPILWITVGLYIFLPMMMGLMIYIVRHPEIAQKMGLLSAKAQMMGVTDWPAFFGLIHQLIATVGLIGFGFVTAWIFGREYQERTIKDILVLPVSRTSIVIAKFVISFFWCFLLAVAMGISVFFVGYISDLSLWSTEIFYSGMKIFLITSLLTFLLNTPVAFFACYSRGIIAPLGFVVLTLILAQFVALSGFGAFFPWAVPGMFTIHAGPGGMQLYNVSYVLLILTFIFGYIATLFWIRTADQH